MAAPADIEDDDVVEERRRVDAAGASGNDGEHAVRLSHLRCTTSLRYEPQQKCVSDQIPVVIVMAVIVIVGYRQPPVNFE